MGTERGENLVRFTVNITVNQISLRAHEQLFSNTFMESVLLPLRIFRAKKYVY